MAVGNKKAETPKFLSGWKEIANYLGKGVRTVQRYEREMGLPVRRPAGRERAAVVATRAELDAWIAASPYRNKFYLPRLAPNHQAVADGIKRGMQEMERLREQMFSLREDVSRTVVMLRESIEAVHKEVHNSWQNRRTYSAEDFESRRGPIFGLARAPGAGSN